MTDRPEGRYSPTEYPPTYDGLAAKYNKVEASGAIARDVMAALGDLHQSAVNSNSDDDDLRLAVRLLRDRAEAAVFMIDHILENAPDKRASS